MKQHHGEILELAIRQSGIPLTKIAKHINYSRQHIYNLFEQQAIDLNLILSIGDFIHHDFSDTIQSLKRLKLIQYKEFEHKKKVYSEEFYKENYYQLLQDHSKLLKKYSKLLKSK